MVVKGAGSEFIVDVLVVEGWVGVVWGSGP